MYMCFSLCRYQSTFHYVGGDKGQAITKQGKGVSREFTIRKVTYIISYCGEEEGFQITAY